MGGSMIMRSHSSSSSPFCNNYKMSSVECRFRSAFDSYSVACEAFSEPQPSPLWYTLFSPSPSPSLRRRHRHRHRHRHDHFPRCRERSNLQIRAGIYAIAALFLLFILSLYLSLRFCNRYNCFMLLQYDELLGKGAFKTVYACLSLYNSSIPLPLLFIVIYFEFECCCFLYVGLVQIQSVWRSGRNRSCLEHDQRWGRCADAAAAGKIVLGGSPAQVLETRQCHQVV